MRSAAKLFAAAALVLLTTLPAHAAAFNSASVPADTQWVIHVDVDTLGKSQLWNLFIGPAATDPNAAKRAVMFTKLHDDTGINLPQDIHDVTLYGNGFAEDSSCVLVHGEFDSAKIIAKLKTLPAYAETNYNGHTIRAATMPGGPHGGKSGFSVIEGKTGLLSNNDKAIKAALDLLDGKGQSLNVTSPILPADQNGVLVYLGAQGLANLPANVAPQSPVLRRLKSAWITIGQSADATSLTMKTLTVGQTNDDATQINTMLQGMKAALAMSAASTQPANQVSVKPIVDSLTINLNNDTVTTAVSVPYTLIQQMQAKKNQKAGSSVDIEDNDDDADTQPAAK